MALTIKQKEILSDILVECDYAERWHGGECDFGLEFPIILVVSGKGQPFLIDYIGDDDALYEQSCKQRDAVMIYLGEKWQIHKMARMVAELSTPR
jgi:hypothetical protein